MPANSVQVGSRLGMQNEKKNASSGLDGEDGVRTRSREVENF